MLSFIGRKTLFTPFLLFGFSLKKGIDPYAVSPKKFPRPFFFNIRISFWSGRPHLTFPAPTPESSPPVPPSQPHDHDPPPLKLFFCPKGALPPSQKKCAGVPFLPPHGSFKVPLISPSNFLFFGRNHKFFPTPLIVANLAFFPKP